MTVQTAPSLEKVSPEDERRRSKRRSHVCEAWVRSPTDTDDSKMEVLSLDLSRHGVGFESHSPLASGCFYWIELGFGDQRIAQEIRVTSCTEVDGCPGVYRVGGEFC
ncbi:MAG TPA: hypothetical protein VF796_02575 [Humisphaera sp.]